jgi:hypothetical protein
MKAPSLLTSISQISNDGSSTHAEWSRGSDKWHQNSKHHRPTSNAQHEQVDYDELPNQLYHVGPNVGLGGYSVKAPSQEIPKDTKQSVNDHRSVTGKDNTCWISVYPDRNKAKEEANKQSVSSGKVHVVFVVGNTQLGNAIIIPADDDGGSELLIFEEIPEKAFVGSVKATLTATQAKAAKGPVVEEFFDAEEGNAINFLAQKINNTDRK